MRWINEPRRLLAVHCLIKIPMEEGVLHIKLTDRPLVRNNNAENSPDSCQLDNRTESLIIINAMLLRETTNNSSSLMMRKRVI
jgi:hypothetical protein